MTSKIYTSSFDMIPNILKDKDFGNLVSIAGYAPASFKKIVDNYLGFEYKRLAPRKVWWDKWHNDNLGNEYYMEQYYKTVLSKLDPYEVLNDLGDNAVMLCYEKPGQFCHRHLVAEWLQYNTNVITEEVYF